MKLRLYKNAQSAQNQADSEALRRRRQSMANASSAESADSMDASTDVGGSELGRQDILHMQQTHGNAFVRRFLAKNLLTSSAEQPATSIQRDSKPGNSIDRGITLMTVTSDSVRKFKGTNRVPGQEGKIELMSFSLSMARPQARNSVARGPAGAVPEPIQLHFMKTDDGSSRDWLTAASDGDRITSVKIEVGQLDEKGHFKAERTIELKHGTVTSMNIQAGRPGKGDRVDPDILEDVEIEFTGTAEFNKAAPAGAKAP